jgi:hypothetical protein
MADEVDADGRGHGERPLVGRRRSAEIAVGRPDAAVAEEAVMGAGYKDDEYTRGRKRRQRGLLEDLLDFD